jgi:hypothetical protein
MVEMDSGVLSMSLIGCLDNASKYRHSLHTFVCQVVCELICEGVLGCHLKAKVVTMAMAVLAPRGCQLIPKPTI